MERQDVVVTEPRRKRVKAVLSTRKTEAKIKPCCFYGTACKGEPQGRTCCTWVLRSKWSSDSVSKGCAVVLLCPTLWPEVSVQASPVQVRHPLLKALGLCTPFFCSCSSNQRKSGPCFESQTLLAVTGPLPPCPCGVPSAGGGGRGFFGQTQLL